MLCGATTREGIAQRIISASQRTAGQHTFYSVKVMKKQALSLSKKLQGEPKNLLLLLYSEFLFVWYNAFVSNVVSMWSYLSTVSHEPIDASGHADGNFASVSVWWVVALHFLSTREKLGNYVRLMCLNASSTNWFGFRAFRRSVSYSDITTFECLLTRKKPPKLFTWQLTACIPCYEKFELPARRPSGASLFNLC